MHWLLLLIVPYTVLVWCVGGQINKIIRPIALPLGIMLIAWLSHLDPWWTMLPLLIYGFELTLGYGENSKLMKWLKFESLVRFVYSLSACLWLLSWL